MENTLIKLISFKTYEGNPDKKREVRALFRYVQKTLGRIYHYELIEHNNHPSLVVTPARNRTPPILLQAHIDVVPGPPELFIARIKGNRLYGRGASDMKCALAVFIELLKNNHSNQVGMWLTSDEEIGGFNGVGYLLQQGYRARVCILPDGGDNWHIVEGAKGVFHFQLHAHGRSAHGSRPWEGDNAIDKVLAALNAIRKLPFFKTTRAKNHWHNTCNVGKIEGGQAINSVPDTATAYCDVRYTALSDIHTVKRALRSIAKTYQVTVTEAITGSAFAIDKSNPSIQLFIKTLKQNAVAYGFSRDHGSSDTRFFAQKKIPTIMCKPACGGHHTNAEWVDLKDLKRYQSILAEFLHEWH